MRQTEPMRDSDKTDTGVVSEYPNSDREKRKLIRKLRERDKPLLATPRAHGPG